jgi:8-oxo-dGTP diphosphatase
MVAVADRCTGDAGPCSQHGYRAAVPVYLIRHAHAGSRSDWRGDDRDRPLSGKGRAQEKALRDRLRGAAIGRVLSSPSRRCVETVASIAADSGLDVETRDELHEGADADQAVALIERFAADNPVISSHGDLVPKILRRLAAAGMKSKDPNLSQKGSLWVIELNGGRPVKGRYYPPG